MLPPTALPTSFPCQLSFSPGVSPTTLSTTISLERHWTHQHTHMSLTHTPARPSGSTHRPGKSSGCYSIGPCQYCSQEEPRRLFLSRAWTNPGPASHEISPGCPLIPAAAADGACSASLSSHWIALPLLLPSPHCSCGRLVKPISQLPALTLSEVDMVAEECHGNDCAQSAFRAGDLDRQRPFPISAKLGIAQATIFELSLS